MPVVTRARTVRADPNDIWEVVADPFHLPRWWPGVARVEDASPQAWTKVLVTDRGKPVRADFTTLEVRRPKVLVWRQELDESPFERIFSSVLVRIELEPEGEGSTHVTLTAEEDLRGRYRLGSWMVRRAARRRLDAALDGLEQAVAPA